MLLLLLLLLPLTLQAYPAEEQQCIFKTIQVNLAKTKPLRGNHTQLLISYQQPHKPVTTDTSARWLKTVLDKAGIDTNIFHAHSTRQHQHLLQRQQNYPLIPS